MKNSSKVFIRVSVICCAILMLSVIGMGFTLAKYVKTSNRDKEEASVAKFGVVMTWSGDAFAKDYTISGSSSLSVKSELGGDKIAPGTTGTITLTVSGKSEVAFNLTINLTELYSDNWKTAENGSVYHPIVLSAKTTISNAFTQTGTNDLTISTDNKINVKDFAAGETISGAVVITWEWPGEIDDDTNSADTYMSGLDATYSITANAIASQKVN